MDVLTITIQQIIKMFFLIVIGIICYQIKFLDSDKAKALSNILLKIVTPLLILCSFQREFDITLLRNMLMCLGLAAVSMGIAYAVSFLVLRKKEGFDNVVERCAATYCNSGFIGYPLSYGIFGSEGLFYMVAFNLIFNLLLFSIGEASMKGKRDSGYQVKAIVKQVLNPTTIASFIGVFFFITGFKIPDLLFEPLNMVGNMNTPLAMIVAGVSIAQMNIPKLLKKKRIYLVSAVKLLFIPVAFTLAVKFLPIPHMVYMTMVLATACPTATATVLFAVLYGRDDIYASEIFTATILFSVITIPLIFALAIL